MRVTWWELNKLIDSDGNGLNCRITINFISIRFRCKNKWVVGQMLPSFNNIIMGLV